IVSKVVLIGSYSNNQCQYPKLHHFLYHMISAIKDYGSPNGWNAETFEFLHKAYIKDPYRMSNKRNVNPQILGTVMRKLTLQEVYKTIFLNKPRHFYQSNEVILYKNYNNIPFRLIETTVNELKVREGPPEIIDGLEHFLEALSEYLKIMPDLNDEGNIIDMMETAIISLYES
ncbi:4029_t:CDS:2, partial [Rhizophagus irregularis]